MNTGRLGRGARGACAVVLLLSSLSSLTAAITQTVNARADAYVRSAMDKKSFGFDAQLDLRMNARDGASEGYVQFALPQHTPFAEKILLRVHAQLAEPGASKLLVRSVAASNWTELALTWRARPEHKETLGTLNIVGLSGAWYEVDVTAFVKAEAALGREAVTFALVPGEESKNRIAVRTRESAHNKPELVFSRPPIAARISFINTNSIPPEGFLADQGDVFGPRTNGLTYGWSASNREFMRDRRTDPKNSKLKAQGRAHEFFAYFDHEKRPAPNAWEIALPHGEFRVRAVAGDLQRYDSIYGLKAEDTVLVDGVPDSNKRWIEGAAVVAVNDGRLTISAAPGSSNNKICFLEITEVETLLTQTK
jgi:hypothetical protein